MFCYVREIHELQKFIWFSVPVQQSRGGQNIPLTPPARISAMNIVGDLLRKVGVSVSADMYNNLQYWFISLYFICHLFLVLLCYQLWTICCSYSFFTCSIGYWKINYRCLNVNFRYVLCSRNTVKWDLGLYCAYCLFITHVRRSIYTCVMSTTTVVCLSHFLLWLKPSKLL